MTGRTLALAALICLAVSPGCVSTTGGGALPVTGGGPGDRRDEAVRVAEQTAVAVTSLDGGDGPAGYDRLLELLTGPAQQEWEQRRAEHPATIASGPARSDSVVAASGIAAFDPTAATSTVLVAVTATVSTGQSPTPDPRHHRLTLSLVSTSGGWKVSRLRFVD